MQNTMLVPIPGDINRHVSAARQQTMLAILGNPRAVYSTECQNPTTPRISELIVHEQVGRLKVRGLRPAVESLRQVLEKIEQTHPDVYSGLGHVGMLCARFVRGSTTAISNHSWGTAIDLTLDGVLDSRGDGRVQQGLVRIAPIFNGSGWFWGAGFRTEDAMHFECSDELVRSWAADGNLGDTAQAAAANNSLLSLGDRGPDVAKVQTALNHAGAQLLIDGEFGHNTLAAVMAFQSNQQLIADGVVGERRPKALFH